MRDLLTSEMLLPNQAVSRKAKEANDFKIMRETAAYYNRMATFPEEILPLYRYANASYIDKRRYKKLLNPLGLRGTNKDQKRILNRGNNGELRNFPIIAPIISKFMGEMRSRSNDYIVQAINPDVVNKKTQALLDEMNKWADQEMFNMLNAEGVQTGVPSKQQMPAEEHIKQFNLSYVDERAIIGQHALNIIIEECRLQEKRMKKFFHWIVGGYAVSYKTVERDTILDEVVAAVDFWWLKSPDIDFAEDSEAQVRRLPRFPVENLKLKFPEIKKNELDEVEKHYGIHFAQGKFVSGDIHTGYIEGRTSNQEAAGHYTTIYHIVWKSKVNRPILTYYDELGEIQKNFVDEDYVVDKTKGDIDIEDSWDDEYWECYEYMPGRFTEPKPLDVQRNSFSGGAKSCYNARAFADLFAENTSIAKLGEDFQQEVNEIRYRVSRTLAKNKDNVLLIDISVIPNKEGWTQDDFLQFVEEFGVAFIDRSQKGADRSFNQYTVLQASQLEAVVRGYELMLQWRNFYWDLVGMNPQRMGKISASAGKGVTEQAQESSSEISEEHFARFEEFEERDIQGLLDLSKFAWKEGKQRSYKRGDNEEIFFAVDGGDYNEMEHRVVAKKAGQERKKVQTFKELLLPMIQNSGQNGVKTNLIASLLDHDSMSELKKLSKEFDEAEAKAIEAQQQATREHEMQMAQQAEQAMQAAREHELLMQDKELENKITVKLIDADAKDTLGSGINTPVDTAGIADASVKLQSDNLKLQSEREKTAAAERMNKINAGVKLYDSDNKLKIAKANKNKHDSK